jgi:hypothetical protein
MKYMVQRSFQTATKFFKTSEIISKPSSFSALNSSRIYAVRINYVAFACHFSQRNSSRIISKSSGFSNRISPRIPIRI